MTDGVGATFDDGCSVTPTQTQGRRTPSRLRRRWRLRRLLLLSIVGSGDVDDKRKEDDGQLLYSLAILACPVGMVLMMFIMMRRGRKSEPSQPLVGTSANDAKLARLRAEADQLHAERADAEGSGDRDHSPT